MLFITKNCELSLSLVTLRLTLKFWLTNRNALHIKNGYINFDQNQRQCAFKNFLVKDK